MTTATKKENDVLDAKGAASQQTPRSFHPKLVNIDRLAAEIGREQGYIGAEFGLQVVGLTNAMLKAASKGELQLYCEERPTPFNVDGLELLHSGLRVTAEDADRLRELHVGSLGKTAEVEQPTVDLDMLATPEELIKVFGRFTGMNQGWFSQLNDKPRLKEARKVIGTGGRRSTPPLLCPYEVMLWLIDGTSRRLGTPLSESKGWELLKKNFPTVYAHHSIGDPNND